MKQDQFSQKTTLTGNHRAYYRTGTKLMNIVTSALLCTLLCLNLITTTTAQTLQPGQPVAQWHYDGNRENNGDQEDWIIDMIATQSKEYVCVGYTNSATAIIFKLDQHGNLLWSHLPAWDLYNSGHLQGTDINGNNIPYTNIPTGFFYSVVESPHGYTAIGYATNSVNNVSTDKVFMVEYDKDGNIYDVNKPNIFLPTNVTLGGGARGKSITMDPDKTHYIITGTCGASNINGFAMYVTTIEYSTGNYTTNRVIVPDNNNAKNSYDVVKVVAMPNSSSSYDVYVCGMVGVTNNTGTHPNNSDALDNGNNTNSGNVVPYDHYNNTVHLKRIVNNILLVKLDASLNVTYEKQFDKSIAPTYNANDNTIGSGIEHPETGPLSARDIDPSTGFLGSHYLRYYADANNYDNAGADLIVTQDNKLALLGVMNNVHIAWNEVMEPTGDVVLNDRIRTSPQVTYNEYRDFDAYLLKIDPSDGTLITTSNNPKNVGHFSSDDFRVKVRQNACGDYIVAGSTADYYNSATDLSTPDGSSALVVCINGTSLADKWRRNVAAADDEDEYCVWGMDVTADGGIVLGGNNGNQNDNFSVLKLSNSDVYKTISAGANVIQGHTVSGTETWSTDKWVLGKVVVPAGATLNISSNATIHFGSVDHLYDYWELPSDYDKSLTSIVVEPGGKLNIQNATLQGIEGCYGRNMWEGIVVQGNPTAAPNSTNQGSASLTNATIKDAIIGLMVSDGYRNYSTVTSPYTATSDGTYTGITASAGYTAATTMGGGIIAATNSTFQDCRMGVKYENYNYPGSAQHGLFKSCNFISTAAGMADICVFADADGNPVPASTHLSICGIDKVILQDNTFDCDASFAPSVRPSGIRTIDVAMEVTRSCSSVNVLTGTCVNPGPGNKFTNLSYGIWSNYTPTYSARHQYIENASFDNNAVSIAESHNYNALTIAANTIRIPTGAGNYAKGIELAGCRGYTVTGNTLTKCGTCSGAPAMSVGILVNNAHTNDTKILQNNFDNLIYGAMALFTNGSSSVTTISGLDIHCNDYNTNSSIDVIRNSLGYYRSPHTLFPPPSYTTVPATIRGVQGDCGTFPTGNRFFNAGSPSLFNDQWVSQQVLYNANAQNTDFDPYINNNTVSAKYTVNYCNNRTTEEAACPSGRAFVNPADVLVRVRDIRAILPTLDPKTDAYNNLLTEKYTTVSDVVSYYAYTGAYDSAAALLADEARYMEAIPLYAQMGDWTNAYHMLGDMAADSAADSSYVTLMTQALDLYAGRKTWYDMDDKAANELQNIVTDNSETGYMADAVLTMLGKSDFGWPEPIIDSTADTAAQRSGSRIGAANGAVSTVTAANHVWLYPNPTHTGAFTVHSNKAVILTVYNLLGQQVSRYEAGVGETALQLPVGTAHGLYMLRVEDEARVVTMIKIVYE